MAMDWKSCAVGSALGAAAGAAAVALAVRGSATSARRLVTSTRRVVTGFNGEGKAVVKMDGPVPQIATFQPRPGLTVSNIWTTSDLPVNCNRYRQEKLLDRGALPPETVRTCIPGGSVFRVIEYAPGAAPRVHATESIDYAVILSGRIDMELDQGHKVTLKAGDFLIQRATVHNWVNPYKEHCTMMFVLLSGDTKGKGTATEYGIPFMK